MYMKEISRFITFLDLNDHFLLNIRNGKFHIKLGRHSIEFQLN